MKKRKTAIAAALSLLPLGQPLLIGTGVALTSAAVMLSAPEKAQAESAEFYFKRALKKSEEGDYYGAISDYNKAIEINPNYIAAYGNRGLIKDEQLKDIKGAIIDYNKALELEPTYINALYNRGNAKSKLNDQYGAISDYNKVIKIAPQNPKISDVYSNRGISKENIGDMKGACSDWRKASELGSEDAAQWVKNEC